MENQLNNLQTMQELFTRRPRERLTFHVVDMWEQDEKGNYWVVMEQSGMPSQPGLQAYLDRRGYVLDGYGWYNKNQWLVWFSKKADSP